MPYLPQGVSDEEMWARVQAERERINALRSQITRGQAQAIADNFARAPWVNPEVTVALSLKGVVGEAFDQIGEAVALKALRAGQFFGRSRGIAAQAEDEEGDELEAFLGRPGQGRSIAGRVPGLGGAFTVASKVIAPAADVVNEPIKAASRIVTGALQTPFEAVQGSIAQKAHRVGDVFSGIREGDFGRAARGVVGAVPGGELFTGDFVDSVRQTTAGAAVEAAVTDRPLDTGSGFFVGGEIQKRQAELAREIRGVTSGGHAWTIGRGVASLLDSAGIVEEGSRPYSILSGTIDLAANVTLDPVNVLGAAKAKTALTATRPADFADAAKAATKAAAKDPDWYATVSAKAGLIESGTRNTVFAPRAMEWLYSSEGRRAVDWLTNERSADAIMRASGKKYDVAFAKELAKASTPDEVIDVLGRGVNDMGVRELPTVSKFGAPGKLKTRVVNRAQNRRAFNIVPESTALPVNDVDVAWRRADQTLAHLNIGTAERSALLDDLVDSWGDAGKTKAWADKTTKLIEDRLVEAGMDRKEAAKITRWHKDGDHLSVFHYDDVGNKVPLPWDAPMARVTEMLNSNIHLVDPKALDAVRIQTRKMKALLGEAGSVRRMPIVWLDFVQGQLWKPSVLIRPAYVTRIAAEEVARVQLGGVFRHPLDWLFATYGHGLGTDALGNTFDVATRLDEVERQISAAAAAGHTAKVKSLTKEAGKLQDEIAKGVGGYQDALIGRKGRKGRAARARLAGEAREDLWRSGNYRLARKANEPHTYRQAMGVEVARMHDDPIMRRVANGGLFEGDVVKGAAHAGPTSLEDIVQWLTDGAGKVHLKRYSTVTDAFDPDDIDTVRAWVKAYADDLHWRTHDDPTLVQAVATGRINDAAIAKRLGNGGWEASDELDSYIRGWMDTGDAPDVVKYEELLYRRTTGNSVADEALRAKDWLSDKFFTGLYGRTSDRLSRSPTFRAKYWERMSEMMPALSPEDQARALAAAEKANLPKHTLSELKRAAKSRSGSHSLDDADALAKGWALDETKDLLFDASKRSQFFDMARIIFPFGEAWREVVTTWLKLLNPASGRGLRNINVARKTVEGLRNAEGIGPGDLDGDGKREGFFYKDAYGQEVFGYPLTRELGRALTGVDASFTGSVKGLSIGTTVIPGFGPVAQLPLAHILPDIPDTDALSEFIFPYGRPEGLEIGKLPPWIQKVADAINADEIKGTFATTKADVVRALAASGKYGNTREELERLEADATRKARVILFMRAFVQSGAPSAPVTSMMVETKQGDLAVGKIMDDYRKMNDAYYAGETDIPPTEAFLEKYGEDMWAYLGSKTKATVAGLADSKEFGDFEREHPDFFKRHKDVAGLFAPEGEEIDMAVYSRHLRTGQRERQSTNDQLADANAKVARWIYSRKQEQYAEAVEQIKQATGGTVPGDARRQLDTWLRGIREQLEEDYPGYAQSKASFQPGQREERIAAVARAVEDESVQGLPVTEATRIYLAKREQAQQSLDEARAANKGRLPEGAQATMDEWLRGIGEQLVQDYPEFQRMWSGLFEGEVTDA